MVTKSGRIVQNVTYGLPEFLYRAKRFYVRPNVHGGVWWLCAPNGQVIDSDVDRDLLNGVCEELNEARDAEQNETGGRKRMAEFKQPKVDIALEVTLTLNESNVRALDALAGYGVTKFIEKFYDVLGKAYMEEHEAGLRDFLEEIRTNAPKLISKVEKAREILREGQKQK